MGFAGNLPLLPAVAATFGYSCICYWEVVSEINCNSDKREVISEVQVTNWEVVSEWLEVVLSDRMVKLYYYINIWRVKPI